MKNVFPTWFISTFINKAISLINIWLNESEYLHGRSFKKLRVLLKYKERSKVLSKDINVWFPSMLFYLVEHKYFHYCLDLVINDDFVFAIFTMVHKGALAPSLFKAPTSWPSLPTILKSLFPLPSFLFIFF